MSEDVLVLSSVSQSVFLTNESAIYNVGIGAPSRSLKIDEKLVVSSSSDTRVKIESATKATSASLYLESGQGVWEIAAASGSTGINNQLSESLVFRTRNSRDIKNTFGANSTFTEALRLNNRGRAGFNIPSANLYDYPQQVQVSGSLNIIQGRTIDINAGTFHNSDGINGIYFNNQKMIYVSGSGANSNYFFGVLAGNDTSTTGADGAVGNIGIGYNALNDITIGDKNVVLGYLAGAGINSGDQNVLVGSSAGSNITDGDYNVFLGTNVAATSTTADYSIGIGYYSMGTGNGSGGSNIGIGIRTLQEIDGGANNIAIGTDAQWQG